MTAPAPGSFAYSPGFYDYIEQGARRSAQRILPLIAQPLAPHSVLDVGCGRGIWLAAWTELGATDVLGLDGDYLERDRLAIPAAQFRSTDISQSFDLGRRWDLVQCLEVAEHIPPATSEVFVQNLARHGDRILFSAAVPGQGGHNHINERPLEYWRDLFARHGYRAYDPVRPSVATDADIAPWYRFNLLLYVHDRAIPALPASVERTILETDKPVPDYSPLSWRLRRAVLRPMPVALVTTMGRLKNRLLRSS